MTELTKQRIGLRLNEILAQKEIKQKELAEHIGVTPNTVSYYLSGERCPDIEKLIEIAKYLNVTTDYLLGVSDVKSIDTELKAVCEYTGLSEEAVRMLSYSHNLAIKDHVYVINGKEYSNLQKRKSINTLKTINYLLSQKKEKHSRTLIDIITDLFCIDFNNNTYISMTDKGEILKIHFKNEDIYIKEHSDIEYCVLLDSGELLMQSLLNQINKNLQMESEKFKRTLFSQEGE